MRRTPLSAIDVAKKAIRGNQINESEEGYGVKINSSTAANERG
jgi:hypothetical protein